MARANTTSPIECTIMFGDSVMSVLVKRVDTEEIDSPSGKVVNIEISGYLQNSKPVTIVHRRRIAAAVEDATGIRRIVLED